MLVALHSWVIIASLTAWGLNQLDESEKADRQRLYDTAATVEHQKNAHWMHDDLCAQLRLVSIQVQSRSIEFEDVAQLLDDLDHQIRLRQLDAIFATETVRVAEIIQPWLRWRHAPQLRRHKNRRVPQHHHHRRCWRPQCFRTSCWPRLVVAAARSRRWSARCDSHRHWHHGPSQRGTYRKEPPWCNCCSLMMPVP